MFKTRQVKSCSIGSGAQPFCELTPDCDAQVFAIVRGFRDGIEQRNKQVCLFTALDKRTLEKGLKSSRECKMSIEYISAEEVDTAFWDELTNLYTRAQLA